MPEAIQLIDIDSVSLAENIAILLLDFTEDTNAKARTRERMTPHHAMWQTKLLTDCPDLVFKELLQRLEQLQSHIIRQPTDIMVAFYIMRFAGFCTGRLNHIRINGALCQPFGINQPFRFFFKDINKEITDDLAFFLGIHLAGELF